MLILLPLVGYGQYYVYEAPGDTVEVYFRNEMSAYVKVSRSDSVIRFNKADLFGEHTGHLVCISFGRPEWDRLPKREPEVVDTVSKGELIFQMTFEGEIPENAAVAILTTDGDFIKGYYADSTGSASFKDLPDIVVVLPSYAGSQDTLEIQTGKSYFFQMCPHYFSMMGFVKSSDPYFIRKTKKQLKIEHPLTSERITLHRRELPIENP